MLRMGSQKLHRSNSLSMPPEKKSLNRQVFNQIYIYIYYMHIYIYRYICIYIHIYIIYIYAPEDTQPVLRPPIHECWRQWPTITLTVISCDPCPGCGGSPLGAARTNVWASQNLRQALLSFCQCSSGTHTSRVMFFQVSDRYRSNQAYPKPALMLRIVMTKTHHYALLLWPKTDAVMFGQEGQAAALHETNNHYNFHRYARWFKTVVGTGHWQKDTLT